MKSCLILWGDKEVAAMMKAVDGKARAGADLLLNGGA